MPLPEKPGFGMATAVFVVVSSMVGTGALTTSGYAVLGVGSNTGMLVLWVIGGLIALSGALTLGELSAMLPKSGGEFVILQEAYGPRSAFLAGWVSLLLGFAAPIAATASAAATYILMPWGRAGRLEVALVASVAIIVLTLIQISGASGASRVQGGMTLAKMFILGTFILAGVLAARQGSWSHLWDFHRGPSFSLSAALASLVYVSYAYTGWNGASYLAGEVRDPGRVLPIALLAGTGLVMALYLGVNVVYALALPAADLRALAALKGREAVEPIAELAASRLFGPGWGGSFSVAVGLLLLGSLSALLLTGPRVPLAMAQAGQLPKRMGAVAGRSNTPVTATLTLAIIALGMLWSGSFEALVLFSGVGLAGFSLATVAAVFVLRWRQPDRLRPFRVPGYPFVPAFYLTTTTILLIATIIEQPLISLLATLAIMAGWPVAWWVHTKVGRA